MYRNKHKWVVYILINFHKCICSADVFLYERMYVSVWMYICTESVPALKMRSANLWLQECNWVMAPALHSPIQHGICSGATHPMGYSQPITEHNRDIAVTLSEDLLWAWLNFFRAVLKSKTHPSNQYFPHSLVRIRYAWYIPGLAATLTHFPFSFTFMSPSKSFMYRIPFWYPLLRKVKTITSVPRMVRENG